MAYACAGARWLLALALVAVACSSTSSDAVDELAAAAEPMPFAAEFAISSPDGLLTIEVGIDEAERARYRVVRTHADGHNELVLADSTLGLELTGLGGTGLDGTGISLADGVVSIDADEPTLQVDRFYLPTGKARSATIEAMTSRVHVTFGDGRSFGLDVWASDTGVAFRYVLDEIADSTRVEWERTSFALGGAADVWLQPHDAPGPATPAYERLWRRAQSAADPGWSGPGWNLPGLFASERSWTLITEADLGDGDAGSHLSPVVAEGEYFLDLAGRGEGNGIGDPRPVVDAGWTSPWRVIITSPDLGDVVESNHVRHLSTRAADRDWSWVRPGRVSWSWWSDHSSSVDPSAIEPFIDLASELGWEYSLVDANWDNFDGDQLVALIDYAAARDVELMLWYNSGGPHNIVREAPRDLMSEPEVRRAEMKRIAALGIAGIKVDFFQSDKPDRMQQYRDILADAADFELLVNFHGSTLPRGWDREFPHMITSESVRGAEIYTFDTTYAAAAPAQNTVLPFTRNVVGSMDYTPVVLGDTERRRTRGAHELALTVVFESGLLHFADEPKAYLEQPDEIIDLLAAVPSVWDQTEFLAGSPGDHVAIGRRLGDQWWIGAINGTAEPITVPLNFEPLGVDPSAPVTRVCDAPGWDFTPGLASTWNDPAQWSIDEDLGPLELVPYGGCLLRIG